MAGMLSPNDLKCLLSDNGYRATKETLYGTFSDPNYHNSHLEIFADLDEEELGGITFEYFLKSLDIDRPKKEKKDTIRRVYRKYDKKNKGYIHFDDLRHIVVKELQEDIDDEVLKEVCFFPSNSLSSPTDIQPHWLQQRWKTHLRGLLQRHD